jgi:hypothetical protein
MDPNELATVVAAADSPPAATVETATKIDDPEETKTLPAITPESAAAEEVAKVEADKAAAEKAEKEKEEIAEQLKAAEESHAAEMEAINKEAAAKEAAKWAQPGTVDGTKTPATDVNVLELNLKRIVGAIATDAFDTAIDQFTEVMDRLKDAMMACSDKDLEVKVIRQDVDFQRVRYEVQLHANRSGDDTKELELCMVEIPFVTGWPMRITANFRGRRGEDFKCADVHELEAFFGKEFKIEDSPVVLACLKYQTKKELKL